MKKLLMLCLSFMLMFSSLTVIKAGTITDLRTSGGIINAIDYEEKTSGISIQQHDGVNACTGNYEVGRTISYRVNVEKTAGYALSIHLAHMSTYGNYGNSFRVYSDGTYLGDFSQDLAETGDWHTHEWVDIEDFKIGLTEGEHVITFEANCKNINIDMWKLTEDGDYVEPPVVGEVEGTGNIIKEDGVKVTMSTATKSQDGSWYTTEHEIPYKNTELESEDIRELDYMDITSIEVNPDITYQEFLGMGTSIEEATINNLTQMSEAKQREILERLVDPVNGMGLTLFRLTIGTSDFTAQQFYTYYDTPNGKLEGEPDWENGFSIQKDIDFKIISTVKLLMEIAEEKGVADEIKFFASPWSPPGWMKEDGDYTINWTRNAKGLVGGQLKDECVDDWAKYLSRFIEEYAKQGIEFHAITIQNEPQARVNYPCCYTSPKQEAQISLLFKQYLSESTVLTDSQKDVKVWGWDHNPDNLVSYMSEAYSYENAIDGAAVHDYGGAYSNMTTLHNAYPEKEMHLSERSVWGTQGMDNIMQYFGNYCESYTMWVTMLDSNRQTQQWGPNPDTTLFIQNAQDREHYWATPEVYLFGQITKYVRPGYVRINSTYNASTNIKTVAFKNPDTNECVLVVVNKGTLKENFKVVVGDGQFTTSLEGNSVATYIFNQNDFPVDTRTPLEIDDTISFVEDHSEIYNASINEENNCLDYVKANGGANFYVNVEESGYYNVYVELSASKWEGRNLNFNLDGTTLQTVRVNSALQQAVDEWSNYRTVKFQVYLTKGKHDVDVVAVSGDLNLRSMTFEHIDTIKHDIPSTIQGKDFAIGNGVFVEDNNAAYVSMNNWTDRWDNVCYILDVPVTAIYTITLKGEVLNDGGFWFDLYDGAYKSNKYPAGDNEVVFSSTQVEEGTYTFTMTGELQEGTTYFDILPKENSSFNIHSLTFTTEAAWDKSALIALINELKNTLPDDYTTDSYANFTEALNHAIEIRDAEGGLQKDVDDAVTQLQTAYDNLVYSKVVKDIDQPLSFVHDSHKFYNARVDTGLDCLGNVKANGGANFYLNIPTTGWYDVYVELAAGYTSEMPLSFLCDGIVLQKNNINQADQSGNHKEWYEFRNAKFHVYLEEGKHDIDIVANNGELNLKTLTFEKSVASHDIPGIINGKDFAQADGVFVEGDSVKYVSMNNWNTKWDNVAYALNVTEAGAYVITVEVNDEATGGFWFDLYENALGYNKYTAGNNEFKFETEVKDNTYVFIMDGDLKAGLTYFNICPISNAAFDLHTIQFTSVASFDELKALIEKAQAVKEGDYTTDTYNALLPEIEKALAVVNDLTSNEAALQDAYQTLEAAYNALTADKSKLAEAYNQYANVDGSKYTKESYDAFKEALDHASDVFNDTDATQSEVDAALKALTDAYHALELAKATDTSDSMNFAFYLSLFIASAYILIVSKKELLK